jgi:hypothetical protein
MTPREPTRPPGRRLDPSLDFCDLCGTVVWRVFLLEIAPELLSPRQRAAIERWRRSPDESVIVTVPLCEPCALLLDVARAPAVAGDASSVAGALQSAIPRPLDATAAAAVLALVARYDAAFGGEPR